MKENKEYLTTQLISYLGNKRALLNHIEDVIIDIKNEQKKNILNLLMYLAVAV